MSQNANAISILLSIYVPFYYWNYGVVSKLTQANWKFSEERGGVGV